MASFAKHTQSAVNAMLRHNNRTSATHHNTDIDPARSHLNYRLSAERDCSDYDYLKKHLNDYHCFNRPDVIKMASWIITAPEDLSPSQEKVFLLAAGIFCLNDTVQKMRSIALSITMKSILSLIQNLEKEKNHGLICITVLFQQCRIKREVV